MSSGEKQKAESRVQIVGACTLREVVANGRSTGVIHVGQGSKDRTDPSITITTLYTALGYFGSWISISLRIIITITPQFPRLVFAYVILHSIILSLVPTTGAVTPLPAAILKTLVSHSTWSLDSLDLKIAGTILPLSRYSSLSMPSLLDLPPELVEQIIFVFADGEPPSSKFIYQQPSKALLNRDYHPLKDLSCVCRVLRRICFFSLFSALKVNLEIVTGFLDFIRSSQLVGRVDSLALYTTPECLGGRLIWPRMADIIDLINTPSLTIVFPPLVFAEIVPYAINLRDAWAFSTEYQVLRLEMPRTSGTPTTREDVNKDCNIFAMRPWSQCIYNEGSSVEAYSTYEYASKNIPSIFCPVNPTQFARKIGNSLDHITSFTHIAVFPFINLWSFLGAASEFKSLRRLRTQLTPTPDNDILDNPAALGKCQRGDLWMELEAMYLQLVRFVRNTERSLEEFVILDYVHPGLHEFIDGVVGPHMADGWNFDPSCGRWTRSKGGGIL